MGDYRFTIPEILSLLGMAQCLYVLVYMLFRAGTLARIALPSLYFLVLGAAFLLDFASRYLGQHFAYYDILTWFIWFCGPPLSVLVVVQVSLATRAPPIRYYGLLFLPVLSITAAALLSSGNPDCRTLDSCQSFRDWTVLLGQISGVISLLTIWALYPLWSALRHQKIARERYWLILSLIILNAGFLISLFGYYTPDMGQTELVLSRTILGLGFIYLVSTSLFRIYPPSVRAVPRRNEESADLLSDNELELALRIEKLFELDKIYQEPGYSRSDLARELETSEATLSKIINLHFNKSFPQLLSIHRIEEAKQLLHQTNEDIKVIAEEVGFNSLASFNRVFKELTGESPSAYRDKKA